MEQLFPKSEEASQAKIALDGYVQCHGFTQLFHSSRRERTRLELPMQGPALVTLHWALSAVRGKEIHFATLLGKESIRTSA